MTRVRIEDLPPGLRAQITAAASGSPTRDEGTKTRSRAGQTTRIPGPAYRCVACGVVFDRYSRWEKHADTARHHRGEAVQKEIPRKVPVTP